MSCERILNDDWCVPEGGPFSQVYTAYADESKTTLLDIAGWEVSGMIAHRNQSGAADEDIFEMTVGNGRVVIDEEAATITFALDDDAIAELKEIAPDLDLQIIVLDAAGNLFFRIEGLASVVPLRVYAAA